MTTHGIPFWDRVQRGAPDECWPYQGSIQPNGYGHWGRRGEESTAHREAWRRTWGVLPPGLSVCHSCDNPPCCNPGHLWLGTNAANMADHHDKVRRGIVRDRAGKARIFSPPEIIRIRELHALGVGLTRLAADYGCVKSTIWSIVHGRTYREIAA